MVNENQRRAVRLLVANVQASRLTVVYGATPAMLTEMLAIPETLIVAPGTIVPKVFSGGYKQIVFARFEKYLCGKAIEAFDHALAQVVKSENGVSILISVDACNLGKLHARYHSTISGILDNVLGFALSSAWDSPEKYQDVYPDVIGVEHISDHDEVTLADGHVMGVCTEPECSCERVWIIA